MGSSAKPEVPEKFSKGLSDAMILGGVPPRARKRFRIGRDLPGGGQKKPGAAWDIGFFPPASPHSEFPSELPLWLKPTRPLPKLPRFGFGSGSSPVPAQPCLKGWDSTAHPRPSLGSW